MKNKIIRTFTVTLAAVLCLTAFSTTAFAGGTDPNPEPLPETTEAPQEEEPTTGGMEPEGVPVTPEGNATLVDDFYGDKQLITVTTKAGNYFYILIDRANEDKETAVHFLNQVDDADLQALLEDGKAAPETCTCTTKCAAGAVNTNCPVCKTNMTECTGPEPEPQEPEETEQPQEDEAKSTGMGGLVVFLVVALIGGGAALYFFKFKKPKADTKGGDELDEYDFGEDEDDEDEAPEPDEEYILTLCGDTVIFSSGLLAEALSRLDEREREMIYLSFFKRIPQHEIGRQYGRSRSTAGYHIRKALRQLQAEMEGMAYEK